MNNDDELKVIEEIVDDLISICEESEFCPRENDVDFPCNFCRACSLFRLGYRKINLEEKEDV